MSAHEAPREGDAADGLSGFAHHYAEVNGTRLHYVSGGLGPAVVLLHGWPYTWAEWHKLMPLLAEAGRTVIAPDLRGLGDSARAESGYEKSNVAEDVRQTVQSLGFASIDLVGTDIGTLSPSPTRSAIPVLIFAENWVLPHFACCLALYLGSEAERRWIHVHGGPRAVFLALHCSGCT